MPDIHIDDSTAALDAVVLRSLLDEHHAGRDPLADFESAPWLLAALGRGRWTANGIRELVVATWVLGGRNTAPLSRWLAAADERIARRRDRPNRKVAAMNAARAAKAG